MHPSLLLQPHGNHFDYVPGHYHYHEGNHYNNGWGHNHGWGWGRRKVLAEQAPTHTNNNNMNVVSDKVEAGKAPHTAARPIAAAAAKPAEPAVAAKSGKESAKQFPHYDYYAPSVVVSTMHL
jgi:hypothetical protein